MRAGLEADEAAGDWKNGAVCASNLSEILLSAGEVAAAVEEGRHAVAHADRSGDAFQRLVAWTIQGDAVHQAGDVEGAAELFREAEAMQAARQPELPLLYSLPGYRYVDLLLSRGEWADARRRASQTIRIATRDGWLLAIALDHLSLGRSFLAEQATTGTLDLPAARRPLDEAVAASPGRGHRRHPPRSSRPRRPLPAPRRSRGSPPGPRCLGADLHPQRPPPPPRGHASRTSAPARFLGSRCRPRLARPRPRHRRRVRLAPPRPRRLGPRTRPGRLRAVALIEPRG